MAESGRLFQLLIPEIFHHVEQLGARSWSRDAVRLVWIDHEPELFARLDQRVGHLDRILQVYAVIASPMHQQQRSMQTAGRADDRIVVAAGIVLRQTQAASGA